MSAPGTLERPLEAPEPKPHLGPRPRRGTPTNRRCTLPGRPRPRQHAENTGLPGFDAHARTAPSTSPIEGVVHPARAASVPVRCACHTQRGIRRPSGALGLTALIPVAYALSPCSCPFRCNSTKKVCVKHYLNAKDWQNISGLFSVGYHGAGGYRVLSPTLLAGHPIFSRWSTQGRGRCSRWTFATNGPYFGAALSAMDSRAVRGTASSWKSSVARRHCKSQGRCIGLCVWPSKAT